jgi:hypothetical protein
MKKIIFICLLLASSFSYAQNEITLYCKTTDGITIKAPLVINYSKNVIKWIGTAPYVIQLKTDEWVTFFQKNDYSQIGGEVAVLNRLTGEYIRTAIADFCQDDGCKTKKVNVGEYRGTCFQQKY